MPPAAFSEVSSDEATTPRKRLEENCPTQKHERQGQKAHLLRVGSEQRSTQDHRGQESGKAAPSAASLLPADELAAPVRRSRGGRVPAGARCSAAVAWGPTPTKRSACDREPDNLLLLRRCPPASGQQILGFGSKHPAPDGPGRADQAGGALPLDARTSACVEPMKARCGVPFASFRAEVVCWRTGAVWPAGPGKHPARGPRITRFWER